MYGQLPTAPEIKDVSITPAKTAKRRAQNFFYRPDKNQTNSLKNQKKSGYEVFRGKALQKAPIYERYQLVIL
jgi:hypothetical protein